MTDALKMPVGYRLERGLLWPAEDTQCARVVFDTVSDMDHALKHVRGWGVAVQAGGNMGVWALHLAKSFGKVVTFEPDPRNFQALVYNTASAGNIVALPCALGSDNGAWCTTELTAAEKGNVGAYQVAPGFVAPIMKLDTLNLPACDLLYLDIEGYEYPAFHGAYETIKRFKPVIAFEDKGLSVRYGVAKGMTERFIATLGYKVVARPHRDVIMVPEL